MLNCRRVSVLNRTEREQMDPNFEGFAGFDQQKIRSKAVLIKAWCASHGLTIKSKRLALAAQREKYYDGKWQSFNQLQQIIPRMAPAFPAWKCRCATEAESKLQQDPTHAMNRIHSNR